MALIPPLRLALAQIDSSVGDLEGNAAKITEQIAAARDAGAELVLFPELALTGYPPEDLLLKEHFLQASNEAIAELAREAEGIVALVGFPERGDDVYNAWRCWPRASCRPSTASRCSRTTACSTSSATSRSARAAPCCSSATRGWA